MPVKKDNTVYIAIEKVQSKSSRQVQLSVDQKTKALRCGNERELGRKTESWTEKNTHSYSLGCRKVEEKT